MRMGGSSWTGSEDQRLGTQSRAVRLFLGLHRFIHGSNQQYPLMITQKAKSSRIAGTEPVSGPFPAPAGLLSQGSWGSTWEAAFNTPPPRADDGGDLRLRLRNAGVTGSAQVSGFESSLAMYKLRHLGQVTSLNLRFFLCKRGSNEIGL